MVEETVVSLTEALFSLEDPWRGPFLLLVAMQATRGKWDRQQPGREEVTASLAANPGLCQRVTRLLNAWQSPER